MTRSDWAQPTSQHLTVSPSHTASAGSRPDLTRNSDDRPQESQSSGFVLEILHLPILFPTTPSMLSSHALGRGSSPRQNSQSPIGQILLGSTNGKEGGGE